MNLSHWSMAPIDALRRVEQIGPFTRHSKPAGLWVSVDGEDDWPSWCNGNDYDGLGPHRYRVHIPMDASNVLFLPTVDAVRDFSKTFSREVARLSEYVMEAVDWHAVVEDFAGIIIAPYHWELRLNMEVPWYYGWDCASGCIWDPGAAHVRLELCIPHARM